MATLQASLLCRPSLSLSFSLLPKQRGVSTPGQCDSLCRLPPSSEVSLAFPKLQLGSQSLSVTRTFRPENVSFSSWSDSVAAESGLDVKGAGAKETNKECLENSSVDGSDGEGSSVVIDNGAGDMGLEVGDMEGGGGERHEKTVGSEGQVGNLVGKEVSESKIPFVSFLMGFWVITRKAFDEVVNEILGLRREDKRLERLREEADAKPKDAAKESALLAELNKQRPKEVIKRFERRDHAVDSRGIAEYLRGLVVTDAITE